MTVEGLAALVLAQKRERLASKYSQEQADAEQVKVTCGKKYARIDHGRHAATGFLMVDMVTGEIFGIAGYGKVDKSKRYGTLETADRWYWGDYSPEPVAEPMAEPGAAGASYEDFERKIVERSLAELDSGLCRGFAIADLEPAWVLVRPAGNWKLAIDAVVPDSVDLGEVCAAIAFYTGGEAEVVEAEGGWRVTAPGYYACTGS